MYHVRKHPCHHPYFIENVYFHVKNCFSRRTINSADTHYNYVTAASSPGKFLCLSRRIKHHSPYKFYGNKTVIVLTLPFKQTRIYRRV